MTNKLNDFKIGFTHYENRGDCFIPSSRRTEHLKLSSGIYEVMYNDMIGIPMYKPMTSMTDNLVDLPNTVSERVCKDVEKFWTAKTRRNYDKYGVVYKRGILLYGPPGTGKTCTIAKIMEYVATRLDGLVLFNPKPLAVYHSVRAIREIEPARKILVIYEDFEKRLRERENEYLALLDGEMQLENIVFIATTNHIDQIPPKIKDRPGRFAHTLEVGFPDEATRRNFLKAKIHPEDKVDIEEWVKATEGLSIDHLKDLIVSVLCIGMRLDSAVAKLKNMVGGRSTDNDADDYWEDDNDELSEVIAIIKER